MEERNESGAERTLGLTVLYNGIDRGVPLGSVGKAHVVETVAQP
jgi:hypothetical protein